MKAWREVCGSNIRFVWLFFLLEKLLLGYDIGGWTGRWVRTNGWISGEWLTEEWMEDPWEERRKELLKEYFKKWAYQSVVTGVGLKKKNPRRRQTQVELWKDHMGKLAWLSSQKWGLSGILLTEISPFFASPEESWWAAAVGHYPLPSRDKMKGKKNTNKENQPSASVNVTV